MAVVEVIEDNVPSQRLLILVGLVFVLLHSRTFCARSKSAALPLHGKSVRSLEYSSSSSSARAPIVAHDISARCGM